MKVCGTALVPDSGLMRKGRGREARLAYQGNVLTANRNACA